MNTCSTNLNQQNFSKIQDYVFETTLHGYFGPIAIHKFLKLLHAPKTVQRKCKALTEICTISKKIDQKFCINCNVHDLLTSTFFHILIYTLSFCRLFDMFVLVHSTAKVSLKRLLEFFSNIRHCTKIHHVCDCVFVSLHTSQVELASVIVFYKSKK